METLRDVMSTLLVTVAEDATVAEAAQVMSLQHVGAALIVDGDHLRGIFTERDIVRALAAEHDAASHAVAGWMTADPIALGPDAPGPEARGRVPAHPVGRGGAPDRHRVVARRLRPLEARRRARVHGVRRVAERAEDLTEDVGELRRADLIGGAAGRHRGDLAGFVE